MTQAHTPAYMATSAPSFNAGLSVWVVNFSEPRDHPITATTWKNVSPGLWNTGSLKQAPLPITVLWAREAGSWDCQALGRSLCSLWPFPSHRGQESVLPCWVTSSNSPAASPKVTHWDQAPRPNAVPSQAQRLARPVPKALAGGPAGSKRRPHLLLPSCLASPPCQP